MVAQEFLEKILEGYSQKIENPSSTLEEIKNYEKLFIGLYLYMEQETYDISRFVVKYQQYKKSLSQILDEDVLAKDSSRKP